MAIILEAVRVKRLPMSHLLFTSKSACASETRLNPLSSGLIQVKQPNADRIYSAGDTSGPRFGDGAPALPLSPASFYSLSSDGNHCESHQPNHSGLNLPVRAAHGAWNSVTSGATHLSHDAFPAKPRGLPV